MRRAISFAALAALLMGAAPAALAQNAAASGSAAEAPARPMDAAERAATIEDLAAKLKARFVFPETGARYAEMLKAHLARGDYDGLTDPNAFGVKVTADLQAVASDGHLKLRPDSEWRAPRPPQSGGQAARPMGLQETRMIGRVAYLAYTGFTGDKAEVDKARRFLLDHAGEIQAVIIDSRENHGGGLDEMNAWLPLFFDKQTVLVRMDTRVDSAEDAPDFAGLVRRPSPPEFVRNDHVVTPDAETRLRKVPLYYLTSHVTASAAEHMALAMKHTHRAVLIGETTRGAGHYGGVEKIGERFGAFIPIGRTYDPDTGWDWEGKGVAPDVAVPADQALDEALKRAKAAGAAASEGKAEAK